MSGSSSSPVRVLPSLQLFRGAFQGFQIRSERRPVVVCSYGVPPYERTRSRTPRFGTGQRDPIDSLDEREADLLVVPDCRCLLTKAVPNPDIETFPATIVCEIDFGCSGISHVNLRREHEDDT